MANRALIAIGLLVGALLLSRFGIIDLIAKGYGLISWGIFFIYFVPLMTVGVYKIIKK